MIRRPLVSISLLVAFFMISMILATTDLSLIGLLPALGFSLFFCFYFIILSAFAIKVKTGLAKI